MTTTIIVAIVAVILHFFAGAEMVHKEIHKQHRAVGDDDEDRRERAGEAIGALFGKLVDLHRDEQELRRHEQDDGGNCGDGAHERGHKAGEEGEPARR